MPKRIILTGGGTGGHITPLLAVAHELKKQDPSCHIIYIGERNGKYASLTNDSNHIDETYSIYAGKFRRYHGESWFQRLFALQTNLLNLRDLFLFLFGTIQSIVLVKKLKADVILLKGGFVGVPIGLAAALWRQRFVTHDSDIVPGLANRLVARWALYHATGMPPEYYGYPKENIKYVGVLVGENYQPVSTIEQQHFKKTIGIPQEATLLLVTGGSGGAAAINSAVRTILPNLMDMFSDLYVVHQVGIGKGGVYDGYSHDRLQVHELLKPMHAYTGASDAVITRAGANTMAELGVQGKPCIVIPNPLLTGGHQLKNAEVWAEQEAALIIDEDSLGKDGRLLLEAVSRLLNDSDLSQKLGNNLQALTVTDAAAKLAELLLAAGLDDAQA